MFGIIHPAHAQFSVIRVVFNCYWNAKQSWLQSMSNDNVELSVEAV